MKTIFFTLSIMLVCAIATAQVKIENPEYGTAIFKEHYLIQNDQEQLVSSSTVVEADLMGAGLVTSTSAATDTDLIGATWNHANEAHGVLEFDLQTFNLPASFTTNNFTARLVGLMGVPFPTTISLNVDLYDMSDDQEDMVIADIDYDLPTEATRINDAPYINGEIDEAGIDVTEQLKVDLFGTDDSGLSSGFIFVASGGTGTIDFPNAANAYIELNLKDTESDADSDSATGSVTDTASDTSTGTTVIPGTDSDTTDTTPDTTDTDYWETETDTTDTGFSGGGGDAKCECSAAGATPGASIWNLLF
ncbi:MAG: hypothetical protein JXR76_27785 [Deltaproteobacteria bacterium]|nr:hypothetical protein [Deltaproteobacteria bacterium]